jgi:hypothetical protein
MLGAVHSTGLVASFTLVSSYTLDSPMTHVSWIFMESEPKRGFASIAVQKQVECVFRTVNDKMGHENRVNRAALTIVDRDGEAASIAHSFQQQPIIVAVSESSHTLRIQLKHISTFLLIMALAVE